MMLSLDWMRTDAPYMPIVTLGLLVVIAHRDPDSCAYWVEEHGRHRLHVESTLDAEATATAIIEAALPDVSAPAWPTRNPQALGPSLRTTARPLEVYRALLRDASPAEARLLRGIATDQVVDTDGVPSRTRLLRGAKSDLSSFKPLKRPSAELIERELRDGPVFAAGDSGAALGLVPEVQTFGGTTGRKPSDVGAASMLLSILLRHGILSLPPSSASRGGRRLVGGPLVSEEGAVSWPRWTFPCRLRELRALFTLASVHETKPDVPALRARGIDAVFRSSPQQLSTTVAVFRWGRRVA